MVWPSFGHIHKWLKPLCRELRSELASQPLLVRLSSVGPPLALTLRGRRRRSWRSIAWRSRMYTHGSRIWFHDARRTARKSGRCRELEFQPPMANTTNTCERSRCELWSSGRQGVGWRSGRASHAGQRICEGRRKSQKAGEEEGYEWMEQEGRRKWTERLE